MAVELTRMDFHVLRFMDSNDVEDMSAAEVGQFCLLLFKAWLGAKDVTLPVDEKKLAKYARVKKVSDLVLKQFPVVDTKEWGPCRQNKVQLQVWWTAKQRSEAGKAGAAGRWDKERKLNENDTEETRLQSDTIDSITWQTDATAMRSVMPKENKENRTYQNRPIQTKSSQSFGDSADTLTPSQVEKLEFPNDLPAKKAWRRCEDIWRQVKREKLISLGNRFSEWERVVENQGSAHAIAAFDLFTRESDGFNPKFGGSAFLKEVNSHLNAVRIMLTDVENKDPDAELRIRMEKKLADDAVQDEIDRKAQEKEDEFLELNKDNI